MIIRTIFSRLSTIATAVIVAGAMTTAGFAVPVSAATASPAKAKVTFTFDDARQSSITQAAPVLAKYGLKGTMYVTTSCVGMTTTPNTCHAATDVKYLTWDQIASLQNTYGWEIGSHSVTHPYMASSNAADGQPNLLTNDQVVYEVSQSKADLAAHGIDAKSFASPYGDYNMYTLQTIAKYYSSHRGFADQNDNVYPYNDRLLNDMQVQGNVTVAAVKAKIDYAIANNQWVVLTFHDILARASTNNNKYQWSTSNFDAIATYVKSKQSAGLLQSVTTTEGLVTSSANLLPAAAASGSLGQGWTSDNGAFTANTASNGSYPETANSIQAIGTSAQSHLLSPRVTVDSTTWYVLKNYLNVTSVTKGEIGFYIDEYDANGNWVSGQYKTRETSSYVENINMLYQPTSSKVKTASLQIYMTNGADVQAYIDGIEWFAVSQSSTPVATNLMPNSTFDAGLGAWTTSNASVIKADSGNHGASDNSTNSVAFTQTGTGTAYLFSPRISVSSSSSYYAQNYLALTTASGGGIGYYIDEYDASGNWVSGQYKVWTASLGSRDVTFSYTPSSSAVSTASLQIIVQGTVSGYLDSSRFTAL